MIEGDEVRIPNRELRIENWVGGGSILNSQFAIRNSNFF